MFRRLLPVSFIVAALALVAIGGAALAIGGDDDHNEDVLELVAADLGISVDKLRSAQARAIRGLEDEKAGELLAGLVDQGTIEQSDADAASDWFKSRPDSADQLLRSAPALGLGLRRLGPILGGEFTSLALNHFMSDELIDRMAEILGVDAGELSESFGLAREDALQMERLDALKALVDDLLDENVITGDEADELLSWLDEIPEWLLESNLLSRMLAAGLGNGGLPGLSIPFFNGGDGRHEFEFEGGREGPFRFFRRQGPEEDRFRFRFFGPDGNFQFDESNIPEGIRPFLDRFDFENFRFEGLDELFDGFREHSPFFPFGDRDGFFGLPEPEAPTPEPETPQEA